MPTCKLERQIDTAALAATKSEFKERLRVLEEEAFEIAGEPFNLWKEKGGARGLLWT